MSSPAPDYLPLAVERLTRLLERAMDEQASNALIHERLDTIMADQTQFAAQLATLDGLVQGFADLFTDVHTAAGANTDAVDQARADGEQAGLDQATAGLAQGLANAQAVLDQLRAQFAAVTGSSAPAPSDPAPADPPADPAPVDAPADPAPSETPTFDELGGNLVLGQPGA